MARPPKTGKTPKQISSNADIAQIQLDIATKAAVIVEQINQLPLTIGSLKDFVENAKNNFDYDFQSAKIANDSKIAKLDEELAVKKSAVDEEIKQFDIKAKEDLDTKRRELESISYEHKLKIRDANITTANEIAKKVDCVVISKIDHDLLVKNQDSEEKRIKYIADAVKEAVDKITKSNSFEVRELKTQHESAIAILLKELEMTKASLSEAKAIISSQMEIIKNHGGDIERSLASARPVFQNQPDINPRGR